TTPATDPASGPRPGARDGRRCCPSLAAPERRFGGVSHQRSAPILPATLVVGREDADVEQVEVVLANHDRVTLRVGDVFLKIDADHTRTDVEVEAMAMAPVPTPEILWRKPPVLALAAVAGKALGRVEEPSTASPVA